MSRAALRAANCKLWPGTRLRSGFWASSILHRGANRGGIRKPGERPPAPRPNSGLATRQHIRGATPCIGNRQTRRLDQTLNGQYSTDSERRLSKGETRCRRLARRRFQPVIGGSAARATLQIGGMQSCAGLPACSLSVESGARRGLRSAWCSKWPPAPANLAAQQLRGRATMPRLFRNLAAVVLAVGFACDVTCC